MSQQERKVKTCKLFRVQENTGDKAMRGLSFKVDFLDQLLSLVEKKKVILNYFKRSTESALCAEHSLLTGEMLQ